MNDRELRRSLGIRRYAESGDVPKVRVEASTPIRAAKMTEHSGARVGAESEPRLHANPQREDVGAASYLLDLEPDLQGQRNIAVVSNDDSTSHSMTLVASYKERNFEETVPAGELASGEQNTRFERDYKAMIQFGAGEASHTVMIDVLEGMTINIPGSYAECIIFDMTNSKFLASNIFTIYKTQASASAQGHPSLAQYTTKAFCPYQVAFDLLNPPTIEDWKRQLLKAVCEREIVTVT